MKLIYGDFETYYDRSTYSVTKMTPAEYILDKRFQVTIFAAIEGNTGTPRVFEGDRVADYFNALPRPWAFVSYNALFDACILAYKYRIYPDLLIDTLGIVRATILHRIPSGRARLDDVARFMDLDCKGDVLRYVNGMRLEQIKRSPYFEDYKKYCIRDVELLRTITLRLASKFPKSELMIMDMVLKMATMPVFCADVWGLKQHYNGVITKKEELLKKVGVNRDELLSNDKFIDAIKALGITPGVKVSPRTGELAWATAKNDPWMMDMAEHPNEDVQALVAARIGVKSTLEETRTLRFISIARSFESVYGKPMLPVPLRYAGAHTHRFSGEWKINMQNLPGRKSKKLRECLVAPRGYVIMAVDASQIEARLTAWLAGEKNLLEQFRNKEDVYCNFASLLYNFPVTRANEIERFTGKTCVLGLGFQMGAKKLLRTATEQAKDNGYDIEYTLEQCELYVQTFRRTFRKIKELWYGCQQIINWMANKTIPLPLESEPGIRIGPCEVRNEMIVLPSGLCLYYYDIQPYEQGYSFRFGNRWKKLYGGLMVENVVQALDRQHVMEAAVRIQERTGFRPAHQVHDELIYVIPESELDTLRVIALEEMRTPCSWAEGLPLDAEVKVGQSYGELRKC